MQTIYKIRGPLLFMVLVRLLVNSKFGGGGVNNSMRLFDCTRFGTPKPPCPGVVQGSTVVHNGVDAVFRGPA